MKRREQKIHRAPLPTADTRSLWKAGAFGGPRYAVLTTLANGAVVFPHLYRQVQL